MGTLSPDPQRSSFADVTGRESLLFLHLSVKFIIQPETGRDGTDSSIAPLHRISACTELLLLYAGRPA